LTLVSLARMMLYESDWERFERKRKLPYPVMDQSVHDILMEVLAKRQSRYKIGLKVSDLSVYLKSIVHVSFRTALIIWCGRTNTARSGPWPLS
jgi:hypothetical protein